MFFVFFRDLRSRLHVFEGTFESVLFVFFEKVAKSDGVLVRIKKSSNIAWCFLTFSGTSAAVCMFSLKKQKRQYRLMFCWFFQGPPQPFAWFWRQKTEGASSHNIPAQDRQAAVGQKSSQKWWSVGPKLKKQQYRLMFLTFSGMSAAKRPVLRPKPDPTTKEVFWDTTSLRSRLHAFIKSCHSVETGRDRRCRGEGVNNNSL